ncbi:cell division protein FtsL [Rhodalgimonas zhirmunskyi]|uniref:Cell division protein FtsL n=1 Tax=Rhodalgimonas zhirmunskyi TaxID=2964767 RepID=A0AAJ1UC43_9RHOB|nr:cell division protein FtsL [Rhodoalgimonas zhirmunskyi]MDQ2093452.1 cell division protein FtsL [Rhodoalgimonas zhirmunskyi]
MRTLLYVMTAMVVIGLAFWAYHENYKTQEALGQVEDLHAEIGQKRARLGMLNAEWAYLNRPERLRELAELNFKRLGLLALSPDQFGRIDQVSYPVEKKMDISMGVDVSSQKKLDGEDGE